WLHYSMELEAVIWYVYTKEQCTLGENIIKGHKDDAFLSLGFSNWKKAKERFSIHQKSLKHRAAIMNQSQRSLVPVSAQLSIKKEKDQQIKIFNSVKYLDCQGLAIHGHDGSSGNLEQLLSLRVHDVPKLKWWLHQKTTWTSPLIQNDLLSLLSNSLLCELASEIRLRVYFAVIVDSTRDSSGKEQQSICLRSVDNDVIVHEDFVGFYEMTMSIGAAIAQMIPDVPIQMQLPIANLHCQTYNGAANMAGSYHGAQALITEKQPLVIFVHCGAHCSNLVLKSVCESSWTIQEAL
uniref:DUF4371 domain-containing protein n=1 Tax=Latimeria chalumnae TaxID=7897 RepID=H3AD30_LATCH